MLTIDGSFGEGGGQILRTALALSIVTGTPFRIEKIRAGRKKSGLLRQHLTAVQAAAAISSAEVEGDLLGSTSLTFKPDKVRGGEFAFAIGTAGSTTLVLQTVLPALLTAPEPSHLILEGGTHNIGAPPFDFLVKSFLPVINRMGPTVRAELDRPGFHPMGGGRFQIWITPASKLTTVDFLDRGAIVACRCRAIVANLPRSIAEREIAIVRDALSLPPETLTIEEIRGANGSGNVVMIEVEAENHTEVFTGFGDIERSAESVARGVAQEVRAYLAWNAPVGRYLTDQILLPFALASGGRFRTHAWSEHARTNVEVIRQFLDLKVKVSNETGKVRLVAVSAAASVQAAIG